MNKTSKTYQAISPLSNTILTGRVLCIDPSTGSQSSMPGYAVYDKGNLEESGIIQVNPSLNRCLRLYEISRTIREEFDGEFDLLIVEYIPPVTYKGGMNSIAVMALQKAIGAIMGARPFPALLEIPASAWKAYKHDTYSKSDEHDAIALGNCAITVANEILLETEEKPKTHQPAKVKKKKTAKKTKRK